MPEEFEQAGTKFLELVKIMARLRAPGGCPWDRKQSFDTIKSYLLEETYEVMEAIDDRNWIGLAEELGDLLLQPVFFAEMAREQGLFTIEDSLDAINKKLVRRHPHVFGDALAETPEDVKVRWDEIKKQEKAEQGGNSEENASILAEVPKSVPALVEAEKIGKKASGSGFDWPDISGVLEKIKEEIDELAHARESREQKHIEHEIGDLLFSVVNLARFMKVDAEQALRQANSRFRKRFAHVEQQIAASGSKLSETPLQDLEALWQEAKKTERQREA